MGKKGRRNRSSASTPLEAEPFVSVCTPTFNRRPFIPGLIKAYLAQTYPGARMEWIVLDDGTDPVRDLFEGVPGVRFYTSPTKMTLGAKRNYLHSKCKGEVIVYMDDDDYYPPTRVAHAVARLRENPKVLCAGSSKMFTYFPERDEMWAFGPYRENHATAATMAFRRCLLTRTSYKEDAALAEEKHFLKNYSIPMVQLDADKTIMVVAHRHNTFDKAELLKEGPNGYARPVSIEPAELIAHEDQLEFYTKAVHAQLLDYPDGQPDNKPDVKRQYEEMKTARAAAAEEMAARRGTGVVVEEDGRRRELSADEVLQTLREQGQAIEALQARLQARDELIASLRARLECNAGDAEGEKQNISES